MNPQTYEYVDNQNQLKTIQATSPEEAIRLAPNRASNSGVALYEPTTATPTQPVETQAPPESSPRLGDILGGYTEDAYGKAIEDAYQQSQSYGTDPEEYRRSYINMFKDRINALSQVYDQQLAKAQQEGKGRVGSGTAILARRGIGGSPRGAAIQESVLAQNRAIEGDIQAERSAAIGAIYGEATKMAVEEAREKRKSKEQGLQTYLDYLKGDADRRSNRAGQAASLLLQQGIDIGELTKDELDKLTRAYKVNSGELSTAYSSALEGELKTSKTKAEIDKINSDIAKGKLIELSEGTILYNTETGETFKNPKTSASGTGSTYGGYNDDQSKKITSIDDKVSKNETYKKTSNMRSYADNVTASLSLGTGTGDLAAINQFQKVIDEGAVTRDQDVQLIQSSQSLLNSLKTKISKLERGEQLSPELRSQMRSAVESLYSAQIKALSKDPFVQSKKKELERYGIDPNDTIIGELGAFSVGGDARTQIENAGYDYQAIKSTYPNLSDDELLDLIGA